MNHTSFIKALSVKSGVTAEETQERLDALTAAFAGNLKAGNQVNITSFGLFEVKLREDQVIVDPTTKKKMLVPPRLEVRFKGRSSAA